MNKWLLVARVSLGGLMILVSAVLISISRLARGYAHDSAQFLIIQVLMVAGFLVPALIALDIGVQSMVALTSDQLPKLERVKPVMASVLSGAVLLILGLLCVIAIGEFR